MDEEIVTSADTALLVSPPYLAETEEVVGEESEYVDNRDAPTSRIHDDYWAQEHPNSSLHTTPHVKSQELPFDIASIQLESDKPQSPLQRLHKSQCSPASPLVSILE